jgi:hypothetical protein
MREANKLLISADEEVCHKEVQLAIHGSQKIIVLYNGIGQQYITTH